MKRTASLTTGRWQYLAVLLLPLCILFAACPAYCTNYYVAPDGNDSNDGSIGSPFRTITHANSVVVAGDTIYLRGGVHCYDSKISITKSGTSGNRITLQNYQNESVILDFNEQPYGSSHRGISLRGDYWYFKGINIKRAGDNGMHIRGANNIIEFCSFYENCDTGLQLSNGAAYNQVINCDSYYNYDYNSLQPGGNADGFAPKLNVGTGNYFYGCRAWQNSDDGYDGLLNDVNADDVNTIYENCWAFKNGYLKDGSPILTGNGQGFKIGGSNLRHNVTLINCLAFDNRVKGFDQNNNKGSMTLYNCTAYNNNAGGIGGANYKITSALAGGKTATVTNCVSHGTGGVILGSFVVGDTNSWHPPFVVTNADFVSINPAAAYGARNADGSLPNIAFMHLARGSDLIDGGTYVGLLYNGIAPDLGAFEYSGIIIFVDRDATGANDGSSWDNAYNYLQDALDDAQPADRIWVAEGTQKPDANSAVPNGSGDRTATFQLKNHVAVYGGYAGFGEPDPNARDVDLYETILSGDLDGNDTKGLDPCDLWADPNRAENSYHVVTGSGTDANTILDGFTITAGNADGSDPCDRGGGMYNSNGSPTVTNCTFSGNTSSGVGGGIFNRNSSSPTLANCTFIDNSTSGWGGGIRNNSNSSPTLTNCTFSGNLALRNGGGMHNLNSSPTVTNCTFIGNSASEGGGGIWDYNSSPTLTNCTFNGNSAGTVGGGMVNRTNSNPTLTNCILWDNSDSGGTDESAQIDGGTPVVNHCCVQGWTGGLNGTGNIGDDPMFVDANGPDNITGTQDDNLRLSVDSNCIDAGDNTAVPADSTDLDNDSNTTEPIPFDLNGFSRFIDSCTADTGNGTPPIVDMGAYEFLGSDICSDGDINLKDFSQFALYWLDVTCGTCGGADLTCDGDVNRDDLKEFTDNWLAGVQ